MPKATDAVYTGSDARSIAVRKARYGHRDWIVWAKDQVMHAAPLSYETVKQALLAVGTQGHFSIIDRSTGVSYRTDWRIGVNVLGHLRHGWY